MAQIFQWVDDVFGLDGASEEELSEHDAEDKDDQSRIDVGRWQHLRLGPNLNRQICREERQKEYVVLQEQQSPKLTAVTVVELQLGVS